jgi:hypothetical protein
MEVLDNIPARWELTDVVKKLRIRHMNDDFKNTIRELSEMVRPIARPKAVFDVCRVDNKQGDSLDIGGVTFTSHVLRVNLEKLDRVFPYIVTCGSEVDAIEIPEHELMKSYFLDQIKEVIVR